MSNVKETLQKVEDLLSDRSKWTQNWLAHDAEGDDVEPESPKAACFCLLGAADRVEFEQNQEVAGVTANALRATLNKHRAEFNDYSLLSEVNDVLGYEAVMKLIRLAKEEAP